VRKRERGRWEMGGVGDGEMGRWERGRGEEENERRTLNAEH